MKDRVEVNGTIKWRHVAAAIGSFVALLTVLATIHTSFILPAIGAEMGRQIREQIERHAEGTHEKSVTYREYSATLERIDRHLNNIDRKLEREP